VSFHQLCTDSLRHRLTLRNSTVFVNPPESIGITFDLLSGHSFTCRSTQEVPFFLEFSRHEYHSGTTYFGVATLSKTNAIRSGRD
jgi:hypothetical protein